MFKRTFAWLCAFTCLATPSVHATVMVPMEFKRLVADARVIAHGRVVDVRGQASGDRTRIETLVTLDVQAYLKGQLGDEVTFVVPGGTLGRYRSVIVGAPEFSKGEEVVVFLGAAPPALPYLMRLSHGVFRVAVDARTGARSIARQPLHSRSNRWEPVVRGSAEHPPMSLSAFDGLVKSAMEQAR